MADDDSRFRVQPVRQQKIYQVIIEQIIDLIRLGRLKVGEKLPPERALAQMLEVSRPSLREALRVMEVIGIVERKPGDGSRITDLNIAHFLNMISPIFLQHEGLEVELLQMRFLLEIRAAELAAQAASERYEGELDGPIGAMRAAFTDDDPDAQSAADADFHRAIFALSGNYVLQHASEFVLALLDRSVASARHTILESGYSAEKLLDQHTAVYEAVRSGDAAAARRAMEAHMSLVLDYNIRRRTGAGAPDGPPRLAQQSPNS